MSKYGDYLHDDSCLSFGEWLCGTQLPEFERRETSFLSRKYEYRMFRRVTHWFGQERDVQGEWCPTMKAAKASYKSALAARRVSQPSEPKGVGRG